MALEDGKEVILGKKAKYVLPLIGLIALSGCVTEPDLIASNSEDIPNANEQFETIFDVYSAFRADGGEFNEDFGGWNYGSDGYLHVLITCEDVSAYEFLNEDEKRVVFDPAEYSFGYLDRLAENLYLTVDDMVFDTASANIHKNMVDIYVSDDVYNDVELMNRLRESVGELPVDFAPPITLII